MQVKATATGYYGGKIREPGESFSLTSEKHLSALWMEPVMGAKAPVPPVPPPVEPPAEDPPPPADNPPAPTAPPAPPVTLDKDALLQEAAALNVKVDARWGAQKIAEAIAAKKAEKPAD